MCHTVLVAPFYLFADRIEAIGNLTLEGGDSEGGFVEGFGIMHMDIHTYNGQDPSIW